MGAAQVHGLQLAQAAGARRLHQGLRAREERIQQPRLLQANTCRRDIAWSLLLDLSPAYTEL